MTLGLLLVIFLATLLMVAIHPTVFASIPQLGIMDNIIVRLPPVKHIGTLRSTVYTVATVNKLESRT